MNRFFLSMSSVSPPQSSGFDERTRTSPWATQEFYAKAGQGFLASVNALVVLRISLEFVLHVLVSR